MGNTSCYSKYLQTVKKLSVMKVVLTCLFTGSSVWILQKGPHAVYRRVIHKNEIFSFVKISGSETKLNGSINLLACSNMIVWCLQWWRLRIWWGPHRISKPRVLPVPTQLTQRSVSSVDELLGLLIKPTWYIPLFVFILFLYHITIFYCPNSLPIAMCYCPHSLWYYSVLLPSFYIVSQCVIVLPSFSTVSQCVIALLSFSTKSQCNFHTDRMSEHIFTFHLVLGWLFVVYHHSITHKSHVHVWLSSFSNLLILLFISQCECPLTCNYAICNLNHDN